MGKPATLLYPSSSIRRSRRTKAEMEAIRKAIYQVTSEDPPMTVRLGEFLAERRKVRERATG